jgi:hypothetical protein
MVENKAPSDEVLILTRRGVITGTGTGGSSIVKLGESLEFCNVWVAAVDSPLGLSASSCITLDS